MPTRTHRECAYSGCSRATLYRYCARHQGVVNARAKADQRFYSSAEWRRLREHAKDRARGMCERCGVATSSGHVDHIMPRNRGGRDEPNNLRYLCHPCHSSVTRTMQNEGML